MGGKRSEYPVRPQSWFSSTDVPTKSDNTWTDPRVDARLYMSNGDGDGALSVLKVYSTDSIA